MDLKDIRILTKAYQIASIGHRLQKRKGVKGVGDPYINHPIEVCNILTECGIDDLKVLCGAVLHDTVEDTQITAEDIEKEFGVQIKNYVLECSDDKNLGKVQRKIQQIQHAKHISLGAKYIKIADKISNTAALLKKHPDNWSKQRVFGYLIWSEAVYQNIKTDNSMLNQRLQAIFEQGGVYKLNQEQRKKVLQQYYNQLREANES